MTLIASIPSAPATLSPSASPAMAAAEGRNAPGQRPPEFSSVLSGQHAQRPGQPPAPAAEATQAAGQPDDGDPRDGTLSDELYSLAQEVGRHWRGLGRQDSTSQTDETDETGDPGGAGRADHAASANHAGDANEPWPDGTAASLAAAVTSPLAALPLAGLAPRSGATTTGATEADDTGTGETAARPGPLHRTAPAGELASADFSRAAATHTHTHTHTHAPGLAARPYGAAGAAGAAGSAGSGAAGAWQGQPDADARPALAAASAFASRPGAAQAGTSPADTAASLARPPSDPAFSQDSTTMPGAADLPGTPGAAATAGVAAPAAPGLLAQPAPSASLLSSPLGSPAWPHELGRQFAQTAVQQSRLTLDEQGGHRIELRLNPAELGPLHIVMSVQDGVAHTAFSSQHAGVRQSVEAALPQLQQALAQAGLSLGQASVGDGQQPFGHAPASQPARAAAEDERGAAAAEAAAPTTARPQRANALLDTFA